MKKLLLLAFAAVSFSTFAANPFELKGENNHHKKDTWYINPNTDRDCKFHAPNNSTSSFSYIYRRLSFTSPTTWTYQFCDNMSCYDGAVAKGESMPVAAGTSGDFKLTVNGHVETGTATLSYVVMSSSDTMQKDTMTWVIIMRWGLNTKEEQAASTVQFPNPYTGDILPVTVSQSVTTVSVLDLNGKVCMTAAVMEGSKFVLLHTEELKPGTYVIEASKSNGNAVRSKWIKL